MKISRLELDTKDPRLSALVFGGSEYLVHQSIWRLFEGTDASAADRPFVYRKNDERDRPGIIIVSCCPPISEHGPWLVETKPYEPKISKGERLAFTLRANPVVTRRIGPEKRHARHDVVMQMKMERGVQGGERGFTQDELCREAGIPWLERKAKSAGFRVLSDSVIVGGYRQRRLRKKGGREIRFSTLDFQGLMDVTDTDALIETLYKGIGPAKGFGCGLLLVRRV